MTVQILDELALDPFWAASDEAAEAAAEAGAHRTFAPETAAARAARPTPTNGDDTLRGSAAAESINGLAGDDEINGLGGDDTLDGGKGVDTLIGGYGDDLIIDYVGAGLFRGGDGDDTLKSGRGNDTLYGDGGADNIDGGAGNDLIDGGEGADLLNGGVGRDTIIGGGGADILTGGSHKDLFVINGKGLVLVSIADFEVGKDLIEISGFKGVNDFTDLKVEFGGCGIMIYDKNETFSIALLNYFGAVDEGDFLFS